MCAKVYDPTLGRVRDIPTTPSKSKTTQPPNTTYVGKDYFSGGGSSSPPPPKPPSSGSGSSGSGSKPKAVQGVLDKYSGIVPKTEQPVEPAPQPYQQKYSTFIQQVTGQKQDAPNLIQSYQPSNKSYVGKSQYEQLRDEQQSQNNNLPSNKTTDKPPTTTDKPPTTSEVIAAKENLLKSGFLSGTAKIITQTSLQIQKETMKDPNYLYKQKYEKEIKEWEDVNRQLADIEAQRKVQLWTFDEEGKLQVNPNLPEGGRKSAEELAGKYGLELGKQYAPQIDLVTPVEVLDTQTGKKSTKYIPSIYLPVELKPLGKEYADEINIELDKPTWYYRFSDEKVTGIQDQFPGTKIKVNGIDITPSEKQINNIKNELINFLTYDEKGNQLTIGHFSKDMSYFMTSTPTKPQVPKQDLWYKGLGNRFFDNFEYYASGEVLTNPKTENFISEVIKKVEMKKEVKSNINEVKYEISTKEIKLPSGGLIKQTEYIPKYALIDGVKKEFQYDTKTGKYYIDEKYLEPVKTQLDYTRDAIKFNKETTLKYDDPRTLSYQIKDWLWTQGEYIGTFEQQNLETAKGVAGVFADTKDFGYSLLKEVWTGKGGVTENPWILPGAIAITPSAFVVTMGSAFLEGWSEIAIKSPGAIGGGLYRTILYGEAGFQEFQRSEGFSVKSKNKPVGDISRAGYGVYGAVASAWEPALYLSFGQPVSQAGRTAVTITTAGTKVGTKTLISGLSASAIKTKVLTGVGVSFLAYGGYEEYAQTGDIGRIPLGVTTMLGKFEGYQTLMRGVGLIYKLSGAEQKSIQLVQDKALKDYYAQQDKMKTEDWLRIFRENSMNEYYPGGKVSPYGSQYTWTTKGIYEKNLEILKSGYGKIFGTVKEIPNTEGFQIYTKGITSLQTPKTERIFNQLSYWNVRLFGSPQDKVTQANLNILLKGGTNLKPTPVPVQPSYTPQVKPQVSSNKVSINEPAIQTQLQTQIQRVSAEQSFNLGKFIDVFSQRYPTSQRYEAQSFKFEMPSSKQVSKEKISYDIPKQQQISVLTYKDTYLQKQDYLQTQVQLMKQDQLQKQEELQKQTQIQKVTELQKVDQLMKQDQLQKQTQLQKQSFLQKQSLLQKQSQLQKQTQLQKITQLQKVTQIEIDLPKYKYKPPTTKLKTPKGRVKRVRGERLIVPDWLSVAKTEIEYGKEKVRSLTTKEAYKYELKGTGRIPTLQLARDKKKKRRKKWTL